MLLRHIVERLLIGGRFARLVAQLLLRLLHFLRTLSRLIQLLLDLNSFQKVDGAFEALAELLLGEGQLLHRLLQLLLGDVLHRHLHLLQSLLEFRGIQLVEQLLQLKILLQRLRREDLLLVHLLDHLVEAVLHLVHFFLKILILLCHLLQLLLLMPVHLLVLFHVLIDGLDLLLQLLGFFQGLLEVFDGGLVSLVKLGEDFLQRRETDEEDPASRALRPPNGVVIECLGEIFDDVLGDEAHR